MSQDVMIKNKRVRKYPIILDYNFLKFKKMADDGNSFWRGVFNKNNVTEEKLSFCRKWEGKSIALLEIEEIASKKQRIVFDGVSITILNNDDGFLYGARDDRHPDEISREFRNKIAKEKVSSK